MVEKCLVSLAHPLRIQGSVVEAHLPKTQIGEICEIQKSLVETEILGYAQVIGFTRTQTFLSLFTDNRGFSRENIIIPTGKPFRINVDDTLAGAIMDATGTLRGRLDEAPLQTQSGSTSVDTVQPPRDFTHRKPINEPLITGVRAIDGLLTCGVGQRIGIFAAAGCGKTSLMRMIVEQSEANIYVIGLVGERGREVTEFVKELRASPRRNRIILIYATSDSSSVERCNAAQIATTVAEYFSNQGKSVLLFIDSITRYARALRDVALSMGEMPARRGYPASVFDALPKLLERPGCFITGSITAFYTVLIEDEEELDVIGDEVRSILDGHIYLSRKLAAQGHYPAIDIMQSISRVFSEVTDIAHQQLAGQFRKDWSTQQSMQLYLDLGEYRRGENSENDAALDRKSAMQLFLKQELMERSNKRTCLEKLYECLAEK
ncbi:type III secretion system ATPase SctN [Tatumella ptyseos]|uniref:type III secretion system ATPase SctN n=1 Tax=Tatumella ptyseos TaxID=82987 RepID=UPI0026EC214B|nr:type III secretion system ATPase SctN [Tatumella ptyseos]WKX25758.1 type III secretion system ATPase SctN [Tatumella ptyseos]